MKSIKLFSLSLITLSILNISYAQTVQTDAPSSISSACVNLTSNMRFRSRDINTKNEVTKLQNFLKEKGYFKASPNGNFGPATANAVKSFQSDNKLIVTGNVGAVSRAKIKELTCGVKTMNVETKINTQPNSNINSTSSNKVIVVPPTAPLVTNIPKNTVTVSTDQLSMVSGSDCLDGSCIAEKLKNCTSFKSIYKNPGASNPSISENASFGISGEKDGKCIAFYTAENSSIANGRSVKYESECLMNKSFETMDKYSLFNISIKTSVRNYLTMSDITKVHIQKEFDLYAPTASSIKISCTHKILDIK